MFATLLDPHKTRTMTVTQAFDVFSRFTPKKSINKKMYKLFLHPSTFFIPEWFIIAGNNEVKV